ncbi:copper resistance CopC family protein [Longispora albida]|uniref:copper resistance CopC family protein n=1 Tax=Longispora albida TaxID=203523 RepID=UPI0003747AE4|nr:copper resistance CopC family protein [Longispora albida]
MIRKLLAVPVLALALVAVLASPAAAHNTLKSSNPANGSTVAAPPEAVTLTFTEQVDAPSTTVTVTGPDGASVSEAPQVAGAVVTVRLKAGPAGAYSIVYQITGHDGDVTKETLKFTATAGNLPAAVPATASPSPSQVPSPAPVVIATAPQAGEVTKESSSLWVWAVLGGAVVLVLAGVALVRSRRGPA